MYQKVETEKEIVLTNGSKAQPVATLRDEYGGTAHIWVDDSCYCLGLEQVMQLCSTGKNVLVVKRVSHIFKEAHEVLKELPLL